MGIMEVHKKLQLARKARRLTYKELTLRAGFEKSKHTQVRKWLIGEVRIFLDQAVALARALEVGLDWVTDPDDLREPGEPLSEKARWVLDWIEKWGWDLAFDLLTQPAQAPDVPKAHPTPGTRAAGIVTRPVVPPDEHPTPAPPSVRRKPKGRGSAI